MTERPAFDLTDPDLFAHGPPLDVYRWLRDNAPCYWHPPSSTTPDGEGFWCLTRYDDVLWAAKSPEYLSSVHGGERVDGGTLIEDLPYGFAAGVLLNMQDDPRHHHMRRVATPSLSPSRLRGMRAEVKEITDQLIGAAVHAGHVDFLVDVAAELPLQALGMLLGVEPDDRHVLLDWADALLDYDDHNPGETNSRVVAANAAMAHYCTRVLIEKRNSPREDLLSRIATTSLSDEACPGGTMSEIEQEMFFHLLAAAGSETTRNTIIAGLLALIERPESWERLRCNRSLLPDAIEEMLRWASSTIYNRRTATQDLERHGQRIHAGDKVVLWWQAANFDERVFPNPETFDIERDPNPHLAFGIGTHFCLGANLARLELDLLFGGLFDRVEQVALTGPVVRARSNKHAGFRSMPVVLQAIGTSTPASP